MTTLPPSSPGDDGLGDDSPTRAWDAIVADLSNDPDFVASMDARRGVPTGEFELGAAQQSNEASGNSDDDGYSPSPWEAYLDEGYEPPEPEPITVPSDPLLRFAWLGVIGGPLVVVGSNILGGGMTISGAGVIAFLAGFAVLIGHMSDHRDDDDDSGAVI